MTLEINVSTVVRSELFSQVKLCYIKSCSVALKHFRFVPL